MMTKPRQRFALPSVWTDRVSMRSADRVRARAIAAAVPPGPGAVLDVGCGDGLILEELRSAGPTRDLYGIDLHLAALQAVRKAYGRGLPLSVADAAALPFRDREFSTAICAEVLEHLPLGVFEAATAELARVATDMVIVSVPNAERLERRDLLCPMCREHFHAYGHLRSFSRTDISGLLPGFRPQIIREIGPRRNECLAVLDGSWRRARLPATLVVCPACGWEGAGAQAGVTVSKGRSTRLATKMVTKASDLFGKPRWLLGVFHRED